MDGSTRPPTGTSGPEQVEAVRQQGREELALVRPARPAGGSRRSLEPRFGEIETLALAFAERFQDEVHAAAEQAMARHSDDCEAALCDALGTFLEGMREERFAYADLSRRRFGDPHLKSALEQARTRSRRRLVDLWARHYEEVHGLDRRDAVGLASFQYDGLCGLVGQVDSGALTPEAAVELLIGVMGAAVERLGGRKHQKPQV